MTSDDHPEWAVRCSWCGAQPGVRCTTKRGRPLSIPSHDARLQTWAAQQAAAKAQQTGDTT